MEFTYDLSQTPIIGRRHGHSTEASRPKDPFTSAAENDNKASNNKEEKATGNGASSPRRSVSLSSADSSSISGWKRPWLSQVKISIVNLILFLVIVVSKRFYFIQARVRESLVNLLTAFGQRVGLPKSPSVSCVDQILRNFDLGRRFDHGVDATQILVYFLKPPTYISSLHFFFQFKIT